MEAAETPQGSFGSRGRREHSTFRAGLEQPLDGFSKSWRDVSGQIIATSNDLGPPNGGDCKGNPLISGKSRLVKYYNLTRCIKPCE